MAGSKVAMVLAMVGVVLLVAIQAASVPEQRSHLDLAEVDSSEERTGAIDRVKDFFGGLSTKVKEGVQDGVVKVKAGVQQGASKAKEYASNVRDYLRDTFSSNSKEADTAGAAATTATTTTTVKVPLAGH
ncbi:uncharacterized protein LOC126579991 [Anopheles aquasalis]|uniref:uncharacterized protein LOC126579991 n=1 Tax=Anopheles aquasalis TaxID=42839 RepID=UPI00215B2919|nr:uncharacterized protein LOC126579991 [Anopheles aquasalis]